jgi:negative regulator of flagellin synthesis FlgM
MHIQGPSHVHGPQSLSAPHRAQSYSQPAGNKPAAAADQLDISAEASLVSQARDVPDIRADRVAQIQAQIEAGEYETDAKLDVALERLLDELVG